MESIHKELLKLTAYQILDKLGEMSKEEKDLIFSDEKIKAKFKMMLKLQRDIFTIRNTNDIIRKLYENLSLEEIVKYFSAKDLTDNFGPYMHTFFKLAIINYPDEVLDILLANEEYFCAFLVQKSRSASLNQDLILPIKDSEQFSRYINMIIKYEDKFKRCIWNGVFDGHEEDALALDVDMNHKRKMILKFRNEYLNSFFANKRNLYFTRTFSLEYLSNYSVCDEYFSKFDIFAENTSIIDLRRIIDLFNQHCNSDVPEEFFTKYKEMLLGRINLKTGLFFDYEEYLEGHIEFSLYFPIFPKYSLDNYKNLTAEITSEIIIDSLFHDNFYNVRFNIRELFRYYFTEDTNILTPEKVKFYREILTFNSKSLEEKLSFYQKYKNSNIQEEFYDDMKKAKKKCYRNLKSKLLTQQALKAAKKYEENGVTIYDLRNQEYCMLIRTLQAPYHEETTNFRDCYSIISEKNNCFMYELFYTYGYFNFNQAMVLHLFESDAFSFDDQDIGINKPVNRIMGVKELINSTFSINEIQIKNSEKNGTKLSMKPDFLIAKDIVSADEFTEALRLGIPIVRIKGNTNIECSKASKDKYVFYDFENAPEINDLPCFKF